MTRSVSETSSIASESAQDPESSKSAGPSRRRMGLALTILSVLVGLLHGYIQAELAPGLAPWHIGLPWVLGVYLVCSFVLILLAVTSLRAPGTAAWKSWGGLLALGMFSSLLVLTLLRQLGLGALSLASLDSASLQSNSALAVPVLALVGSLVGLWIARITPRVVEVDIPLPGLPASLEGFRIAQITDIHIGPTIRRGFLERVVRRVNSLDADVVAITGDVVDGRVDELREHTEPLSHLKARSLVALVIGNHELYSGAPEWVIEYRRLGLSVLLNEHVILQRGDHHVMVAGVTDHTTERFYPELACDPVRAMAGARIAADVRVLLAHQPITAARAVDAGYQLSLHGHTHGGQWWPWNHFVRLQQPVTRGLVRMAGMWTYTSSGTGYWGPPLRHFRSEITLLRLTHA